MRLFQSNNANQNAAFAKNGHNEIQWVYLYLYGTPVIKVWFAPKTAYKMLLEQIFRPGREIMNVRAYSKFVKNNWLLVR